MTEGALRRAVRADHAATALAALRFVALAIVLAGIVFRFSNLDRKIFSYDEATTSIRVAGYTLAEFYHDAFDGKTTTNARYLQYQHVDGHHDAAAAVRSLAVEDPQHPPLYYALERGWSQAFGNSVSTRREVSAIAGALMLFAAVWLGFELTGGFTAGLVLAALIAVSPFWVIYSQQAREYSVWGLCTLVASAALIRALRRGGLANWSGYALAAIAGLYGDLLFAYVLAGHALFVGTVVAAEGRRRRALAFACTAAVALVAFTPWLAAVERGRDLLTNNDYLSAPVPAAIFALKWLFNSGAVFFDLDYRKVVLGIVLVPIFALLVAALADLFRGQPVRTWAFVVTLGLTTAAALLVPDLAGHESRSTAARYLVPTWLAFELAVALFIGRWMESPSNGRRRALAGVAFGLLVVCGVSSVAVDSGAETSWAEGKSIAGLGPIARTIALAGNPLVVYVDDPQRFDFAMLALSNRLPPGVRVQQLDYGMPLTFVTAPGPVYVLDPTDRVKSAIRRSGARLELVYADVDDAPDAVRGLRVEAARARAAHGVTADGLSLWKIEGHS